MVNGPGEPAPPGSAQHSPMHSGLGAGGSGGASLKRASAHMDDAPDTPDGGGRASPDLLHDNRKKRTGNTSARGVANLTPDQLAKKRANDREAQRAIRERTKNQIETLEQRIRDLSNQQPYQELQVVIRQKEAAEAENADLKRRLASILALVQPVVRAESGGSQYTSPYAAHAPTESNGRQAMDTAPMSAPPPAWNGQAEPQQRYVLQAPMQHTQPDLSMHVDLVNDRRGMEYLLDAQSKPRSVGTNGYTALLHEGPTYGPRHPSLPTMPPTVNPGIAFHALPRITYPPYTEIPATSSAECPLDYVLIDFISTRRASVKLSPSSLDEVLGPPEPAYAVLLDPSLSEDSHPLSKLLTDILVTFPDIARLAERVAVLYFLFLYLRWHIHPTREAYELLPPWLRPSQRAVSQAHPAWIDHLPWPEMRELIIADSFAAAESARKQGLPPTDKAATAYPFEDFFIPFTTTCSVNWGGVDSEVLLRRPRDSERRGGGHGKAGPLSTAEQLREWTVNPAFEAHMRKLESWSLGPAFAKALPRLVGTFRLKE